MAEQKQNIAKRIWNALDHPIESVTNLGYKGRVNAVKASKISDSEKKKLLDKIEKQHAQKVQYYKDHQKQMQAANTALTIASFFIPGTGLVGGAAKGAKGVAALVKALPRAKSIVSGLKAANVAAKTGKVALNAGKDVLKVTGRGLGNIGKAFMPSTYTYRIPKAVISKVAPKAVNGTTMTALKNVGKVADTAALGKWTYDSGKEAYNILSDPTLTNKEKAKQAAIPIIFTALTGSGLRGSIKGLEGGINAIGAGLNSPNYKTAAKTLTGAGLGACIGYGFFNIKKPGQDLKGMDEIVGDATLSPILAPIFKKIYSSGGIPTEQYQAENDIPINDRDALIQYVQEYYPDYQFTDEQYDELLQRLQNPNQPKYSDMAYETSYGRQPYYGNRYDDLPNEDYEEDDEDDYGNYNIAYNPYTIQKGDTLSQISKRTGVDMDALAYVNGIKDKNKIYAGKTLYIPSMA